MHVYNLSIHATSFEFENEPTRQMDSNGKKNPTEIKGSDLTAEQIEAASNFLSGANWKSNEPTRKTSRADIVKLLAWYAAVRYQAGVHGIGSLEKPGNTVCVLPKPDFLKGEFEIVLDTELENLQVYKLDP